MSGALEVAVPETLAPEPLADLLRSVRDALAGEPPGPVVLRGGRKAFCRGLDPAVADEPSTVVRGMARDFVDVLLCIRRADRPFVAVVEGAAYGGGVGLAAACDVVLASRAATFGLPEVLLGLAPLTILPVLRERMSAQGVRRMALTGFGHEAGSAAALGLVDEVVETANLPAALARWLRALGRGRPAGVAALKRHSAEADGLEAALLRGASALEGLLGDPAVAARARALETGGVPWGPA